MKNTDFSMVLYFNEVINKISALYAKACRDKIEVPRDVRDSKGP